MTASVYLRRSSETVLLNRGNFPLLDSVFLEPSGVFNSSDFVEVDVSVFYF